MKRRPKRYPFRSRANIVVRKGPNHKKPKKEHRDDPGGEGEETVQELSVCPDCAAHGGQA